MAGRFPGADNVAAFWDNLCRGVESISFFTVDELRSVGVAPKLLDDPRYVRACGLLPGVDLFDAPFFGYTSSEAEVMDPQQRSFLECAWAALEDAGYAPDGCRFPVGVFAGQSYPFYLLFNVHPSRPLESADQAFQALSSNDKDFLATRVAYKLNLKGPAVSVQAACSTSLVAVHLACQSLISGDCDLALAGGVGIRTLGKTGYLYEEGGVLSRDGHCRAFDSDASGTVTGNGVAAVVLKRLADARADGDTIHAVIRGSAINNDGSAKVGYTASSIDAQAAVVAEALAMAGVDPSTIGYIETHGTGTPLGDPIEIAALARAFGPAAKRGRCAIGSVKTNIGHLDAAAGVTGLIKAVLAVERGLLPPSLNFTRPNANIELQASPFYVVTRLTDWKKEDAPRRAGVTSLGLGGTNVHVIVEEAPARDRLAAMPPLAGGRSRLRPWHLLVLSAKTERALEATTAGFARHLAKNGGLEPADVAYTLSVGRSTFRWRRAAIVRDLDDAVAVLSAPGSGRLLTGRPAARERAVAFMFPGQGTQYVNMALELYRNEPAFADEIDRCSDLLRPRLGLNLREVLYPGEGAAEEAARRLEATAIAQPALFTVERALAKLLMHWGIRPCAMIGHGVGELVAASLAEVFTIEDALALVAARGRLVQDLPAGAMLAIPVPEAEASALLGSDLSLAAVDAPGLCTVSGPIDAVEALHARLAARGLECRRLHTSHAFHSRMMDTALDPFAAEVRMIKLSPPGLPYLSNVSGTWIRAEEAVDPEYWVRHLRRTVRFAAGLRELLADPEWVLLEVGPGRALATLTLQQGQVVPDRVVISTLPHAQSRDSGFAFFLSAVGRLWLAGGTVDWRSFYEDQRRYRVPLPTYPFERERYWIDPPAVRDWPAGAPAAPGPGRAAAPGSKDAPPAHGGAPQAAPPGKARPDLPNPYVAPESETQRGIVAIWERVLGFSGIGIHDDLFDLGGHSLTAAQITARLRQAFSVDVPVRSLFEGPTVAELAQVIERAKGQPVLPQ
jgi:acyl transferase domain-containing protein